MFIKYNLLMERSMMYLLGFPAFLGQYNKKQELKSKKKINPLPKDLQLYLLNFLNFEELRTISQVNRIWRQVSFSPELGLKGYFTLVSKLLPDIKPYIATKYDLMWKLNSKEYYGNFKDPKKCEVLLIIDSSSKYSTFPYTFKFEEIKEVREIESNGFIEFVRAISIRQLPWYTAPMQQYNVRATKIKLISYNTQLSPRQKQLLISVEEIVSLVTQKKIIKKK